MSDLAAEGDRLHAFLQEVIGYGQRSHYSQEWMDNMRAVAAALRERDAIATRALEKVARAHELYDRAEARADALRARCAAAEADADRLSVDVAALKQRLLLHLEHPDVGMDGVTGMVVNDADADLAAHAAAVETHRE